MCTSPNTGDLSLSRVHLTPRPPSLVRKGEKQVEIRKLHVKNQLANSPFLFREGHWGVR